MARVLMLLPARDFDPSEAAVSWQVLKNAGHAVAFATPDGKPAAADDMMLTGRGLDPWGAIPLLRNLPVIGLLMRANADARPSRLAAPVMSAVLPRRGFLSCACMRGFYRPTIAGYREGIP